jgi:hypothetical protein
MLIINKLMSTKLSSPRVSFRDENQKAGKNKSEKADRGIQSTQESEESPRRSIRKEFKSGTQGEFSGYFDQSGHHLKSDGTPDMRFKENREEFTGQGYEYSSVGGAAVSQPREYQAEQKEQKEAQESKPQQRGRTESQIKKEKGATTKQPSISGAKSQPKKVSKKPVSKTRMASEKKRAPKVEHVKGGGTPDMRFKENRDEFSGQGYENINRPTYRVMKANMGMYEGNVPGEHSGKYDKKGHHLKNDGTFDMRFKENREEFSGQGYEYPTSEKGYTIKTRKYQFEEDPSQKNISYHRRRPATPYAQYIREQAPEMKRENPDMDMNEVFRELGRQWQGSSKEYKQKYYDMYDEEVKRYEEMNGMPHHRGMLSMRKYAEKRGFHVKSPGEEFGSKRGKFSNMRKNYEMQETNEDDEEDENYNPDEENKNPNEKISA